MSKSKTDAIQEMMEVVREKEALDTEAKIKVEDAIDRIHTKLRSIKTEESDEDIESIIEEAREIAVALVLTTGNNKNGVVKFAEFICLRYIIFEGANEQLSQRNSDREQGDTSVVANELLDN